MSIQTSSNNGAGWIWRRVGDVLRLVEPFAPRRFTIRASLRTRHFLWRRSPQCCSPLWQIAHKSPLQTTSSPGDQPVADGPLGANGAESRFAASLLVSRAPVRALVDTEGIRPYSSLDSELLEAPARPRRQAQ